MWPIFFIAGGKGNNNGARSSKIIKTTFLKTRER
jgi:hypothetical protein